MLDESRSRSLLVVACAVTLAVACSGPDAGTDAAGSVDAFVAPTDAPSTDAPSTDVGSSDVGSSDAGASTSTAIVAVAGGVARSADGHFAIYVTPGALAADTTITIVRVAPGDVPADVAARQPVSEVYAVEPDGLTFGGNGAWAYYGFDTIPAALVSAGTPPSYAGMRAVTRPRAGGASEVSESNQVSFELAANRVDMIARLPHLSYQYTERAELEARADMGATEQEVGAPWRPTLFSFGADVTGRAPRDAYDLSFLVVCGFGDSVVASSVPDAVDVPQDLQAEVWTHFGSSRRLVQPGILECEPVPLGSGPSPRTYRPAPPQYVCLSAGAGHDPVLAVSAAYDQPSGLDAGPAGGGHYEIMVQLSQQVDCVAPAFPPVRARVEAHASCVREGATYTCPAPTATSEVEVPPASSTVNLAPPGANYYRLVPAGAVPGAGPTSVTATDGAGSAMHATRDAAGTYTETFDDAFAFDFSTPISFTADGSTPVVVDPPPAGAFHFGPVTGLDTDVQVEDPRISFVDVEITRATIVCHGRSFDEGTLFTSLPVSDLGGGVRGLDAPVQTLVNAVAADCGVTPASLTSGPFYITIRVGEDRSVELGTTTMQVSTGRSTTIDGASLLATCPGTQTYCTDHCVSTATDPLNCGGCGLTPLEVCNGVDDDCDGAADEGCPNGLFMFAGNNQVSPHFGDTTRPAGTFNTPTCGTNLLIGLCGSTNADGSVRQVRAVCGSATLRRVTTTTPWSFVVDVAELAPGTCETGTSGGGWTGGTTQWAARCPSGMVADGIEGQETGNLEQLVLRCTEWAVRQDGTTGVWHLAHGMRATSPVGASGGGTTFGPWQLADDASGQPGAIRQMSMRYFDPVAGQSDVIDLWVAGRTAELR